MSANKNMQSDDTEVSVSKYTAGRSEDIDLPGAIVRLEGDGPQSIGEDVTVGVAVHDDGHVELTVTADFENADRLLDRD